MQYLLSEEELAALRKAPETVKQQCHETIQKLCTEVAILKPVKSYTGEMRPWGCILTANSPEYCDLCPVRTLCPFPHKEWSK
jgi:hypothetical protein